MKQVTRFELEDATYVGGGAMESAEATFAQGRFTFVLDGHREFEISRAELAELVQATDEVTAPFVTFETMGQAEEFLRRSKGHVVRLTVRRKSGSTEQRDLAVYRIARQSGRMLVIAHQRDHEHVEVIPLASIVSGQATDEVFEPRYEVEL